MRPLAEYVLCSGVILTHPCQHIFTPTASYLYDNCWHYRAEAEKEQRRIRVKVENDLTFGPS